MKNVFIINPCAGKAAARKNLEERIKEYVANHPETSEILYTTCKGDGTRVAREVAQRGEEVRIFSCGGDGSAFDVLNGVVGYPNVAIGILPAGTGNDFLKTFCQNEHFFHIEDQVAGTEYTLDVIQAGEKYCLNQASMGLDAQVCAHKDKFSRLPLVSGQLAYILALLYCFFLAIRNRFTITVDDAPAVQGDYLLAVAANGRFYGGGFKSAPTALPDDELMDCMAINSVSRFRILSLLKKYTKGEHVTLPICHYVKGKKMTVSSEKETVYNLDGEVFYANEITFSLLPGGVRFVVPKGSSLPERAEIPSAEKEPALV